MSGGEFRRNWPVVSAAAIGAGLGVSGLLTYNAGLFQPALAREFGLSGTLFGAAVFGSTLTTALAVPLVGRAVDRLGARPVAALGAALLSLSFLALGLLTAGPRSYIVLMALAGALASGSTPVAFTSAVSATFDRSRGLALGLTQVGIGVSAALIPPLIGGVVASQGWRSGFLALAMLAAAAIVPAVLALPGRGREHPSTSSTGSGGLWRDRHFRVQAAAFAMMAFAFAGMLSHFVPLLSRSGVPLSVAGRIAGLIGLSVIVSRVLIGWLADRVEPAWLGSGACLLCAAGCSIMAVGGAAMAPWGAVSFGSAMGAEADLIAILTARYFPRGHYGQAYGPQYSIFMLAAGISPLWIGYLADRTGSYAAPLSVCAGLLVIPAILFAALPTIAVRCGR